MLLSNTLRLIPLAVVSALVLTACATSDAELDRKRNKPAFELYNDASESLEIGNWKSAIEKLERLDSNYPFGPYSQQAQIDLLYAYFQAGETSSATSAAERFIRQNPRHPHLDYVYYLKGMVNFSAELGFKEILSAPLSERDAGSAHKAFDDFSEMLKLFPDSKYAHDAQLRMIYLRNRLAEYELHVARYYISRKAWNAAANRARAVVDNFPGASNTEEALTMLVECYEQLQLPLQAQEAKTILALNFPGKAAQ